MIGPTGTFLQPQRDTRVWVLFLGSWKLLAQYLQDAGTEQSQFSICQFAQSQSVSTFSLRQKYSSTDWLICSNRSHNRG